MVIMLREYTLVDLFWLFKVIKVITEVVIADPVLEEVAGVTYDMDTAALAVDQVAMEEDREVMAVQEEVMVYLEDMVVD